jgi:hypothetical protein
LKITDDFMAKTKTVSLFLLTSLLLIAALAVCAVNVQAQSQATVTILPSTGGTTDPAAGNYTYNDGTTVNLTATSDMQTGLAFLNWVITTSAGSSTSTDNPLALPVSGGTTYTVQAVFQVIVPLPIGTKLPTDMANAAIIVVLDAAGGTTIPAPGTYALANAVAFNLTAMPNNGWAFSHWVISGNTNVSHETAPVNLEPTDNPYNVNHGYGATYYYQPVFTQTNTPTPSPTIPEFSALALVVLLGALIPVAIFATKHKGVRD